MALAAYAGVNAQGKGNIEFGLGVGYNTSNVATQDESADYKHSFNFGASADYYFSEAWSIKAKVYYDKKGWDNDIALVGGDMLVRTNINTDYITVPVLASWHFGRTRNWYLHFGPYAGFMLNAEETATGLDIKENFNTTDAGLAVGIGVKIPLNDKLRLFIEYDYQSGFSDVFKENYFEDEVTTGRGALNVGLNFLL